jgi:two-component system CitB family sensor kinase
MGEELLTIVGNLVQNAIEEVTDLPAERRYVEVTIDDHTGESLLIQVRDWGGGVPDALLTEIFTLGFTTKPVAQRGIGLSLVAGLVKRLGGTITVRNDGGAVFTVMLPLHEATPHFHSIGRP